MTSRIQQTTLPPSKVVFNRAVGPGWYVLRLEQAAIATAARPGQFVEILCRGEEEVDPLLRRPFSVYAVDRNEGTYDILYTVVGRGTRWMATLPEAGGSSAPASGRVDVEGPFGTTFTVPSREDHVYLVGGGVGVAPLYFLAQEMFASGRESPGPPPSVTLCMGARTRELLQGLDDFRRVPLAAHVATDDGSEGFHGFVTDLLAELLETEQAPERVTVYGCGPQAMNESLRALLTARGLRGEICLESLMACGFGICYGCVAPIRKEPGGEYFNRRVCKDGPVFDARLLHPGIEG